MAERKIILVLANSIRVDGNRCVAGKELHPKGTDYEMGGWIRLSESSTKGGAVSSRTTMIEGQGMIQPLDIIEVAVTSNCNDPDHPEDWWLQPQQPWQYVERSHRDSLPRAADPIASLWADSSGNNTVNAGYVQKMGKNAATLALIKAPAKWEFEYWKEFVPDFNNPGQMKEKRHRNLSFIFGGRYHAFSVTDPEFMARHNIWTQMELNRPKTLAVTRPEDTFFCLSLTPEFNGKHYKICATIFEP
jgi:hypothetical protein